MSLGLFYDIYILLCKMDLCVEGMSRFCDFGFAQAGYIQKEILLTRISQEDFF